MVLAAKNDWFRLISACTEEGVPPPPPLLLLLLLLLPGGRAPPGLRAPPGVRRGVRGDRGRRRGRFCGVAALLLPSPPLLLPPPPLPPLAQLAPASSDTAGLVASSAALKHEMRLKVAAPPLVR